MPRMRDADSGFLVALVKQGLRLTTEVEFAQSARISERPCCLFT